MDHTLFGAKPFSEPLLTYFQLGLYKLQCNLNQNIKFVFQKNTFENGKKILAILSRASVLNCTSPLFKDGDHKSKIP